MIWIAVVVLLVVVLAAAAAELRGRRGAARARSRRRAVAPSLALGQSGNGPPVPARGGGERRILFPFFAQAISSPALAAALRLARVEQATLVAVYLARVSLDLPLDAPIPRQAAQAIPLQEAIEQEAARVGVAVDARIARGRDCRHALKRAIAQERFDRVVVAAAGEGVTGLHPDDVAWLLTHARGEIIVIRPDPGSRTNRRGAIGSLGNQGRPPSARVPSVIPAR